MSEDKKRDRALQRRVRERQEKTGESYQAAWRQLADQDTRDHSHVSTGLPPLDTVLPVDGERVPAAVLPVDGEKVPAAPLVASNEQLLRINSQMFDKLDDVIRALTPNENRRIPLPLSTNVKILPGQSAQITARPQLETFWPDRLLIKNAERWDVHKLTTTNDRGREFSLTTIRSGVDSGFSSNIWRPLATREILCGDEVVLVVTYTGPNEEGETFESALFGCERCPPDKPEHHDATDASERISVRGQSKNVRPTQTTKLPLIIEASELFVDRFTIGDAQDWLVNDIRIHGQSIFVQAGDIPGEMFQPSAIVILERLGKDDVVEITASYVGTKASARLVVELSGTAKPSKHSPSYFLPMSTGVAVAPTQSAQITARPQRPFLPERLVIADSDEWIVNDIRIGVRYQLAATGDIPGQSFSCRTVGGHITLDPVRAGQDFIMVTTRGEDHKHGAPFLCGVQGRLV